jgi:hypothetical protein
MAATTIQILPPALRTITDRLNFQTRGPSKVGRFETYEVDLSEWSLSLTDTNPCIWVQACDLENLSPPQLADSLKDVVRERGWQYSTILVFMDGHAETLRPHLPSALPTFVTVNAKQQARVQKADSPTVEMLDILLSQIPRSQLSPYETHKPVVGSQFFGRQFEINQVLQKPTKSYLFLGIRRIGKTSLLKELKRRMDRLDPPQNHQTRRLYIDCTVINSEEEFLQTVTYQLAPTELKLLMRRAAESKRYQRMMFDRFVSLHGGPITFLIDELDRLLPNNNDWHLFDVLRAAANEGKARFIMAGFRRAMLAVINQNAPLFNWADPIHLNRLHRSDVKRMVLSPLERLRISIQNPEGVVNRINRETAGLPNYVQLYCKSLLERLDEEERNTLTEDDLQAVYESREFRDFVLDTFVSNSEPLERALVYGLVAENSNPTEQLTFSQRTIDSLFKRRKLPLTLEQLDRSCRSLEIAGVFNQVGQDFEFAIPLFQQMLRQTRDVEFLFEKTREEILATKPLT